MIKAQKAFPVAEVGIKLNVSVNPTVVKAEEHGLKPEMVKKYQDRLTSKLEKVLL